MPSPLPRRIASDADIERYSTYVCKLAAIASQGDPAPVPFRTWFIWTYEAIPVLEKVAAPSTVDAA